MRKLKAHLHTRNWKAITQCQKLIRKISISSFYQSNYQYKIILFRKYELFPNNEDQKWLSLKTGLGKEKGGKEGRSFPS